MTIHVHIAAAACACNIVLYADSACRQERRSRAQTIFVGAACFLVSLASHFLLDSVPHDNILYGLGNVAAFPRIIRAAWFLVKIGSVAIPLLALSVYLTRDHWLMACITVAGSLYPDVEKTLYLRSILPRSWVVFPWHSLSYSPLIYGRFDRLFWISVEFGTFLMLLAGLFWAASRRNPALCRREDFWNYWKRALRGAWLKCGRMSFCRWHEQ